MNLGKNIYWATMILSDFKTTTHGKWILAGEHAVLRGHGALVFPLKKQTLAFRYKSSETTYSIDSQDPDDTVPENLIHLAMQHGYKQINRRISELYGRFEIENNIPVSLGMGASAALSVAITRWFIHQKFIDQNQLYDFAKSIEDVFHGKSSGLDVAGVANPSGVYFQNNEFSNLSPAWTPIFMLSPGGAKGITSLCVNQVKSLWAQNPKLGRAIDQQMQHAVMLAKESLEYNSPNAFDNLVNAINQAENCFRQWGLITVEMDNNIQHLKSLGAKAVKPTGSGGGGFLLSLWAQKPEHNDSSFIFV